MQPNKPISNFRIAILAACAIFLSFTPNVDAAATVAQPVVPYSFQTLSLGGTNSVWTNGTGNVTNFYTTAFSVARQNNLGIQVTTPGNIQASNTACIFLDFQRSLDGVYYETNIWATIAHPIASVAATNYLCSVTNYDVSGIGYIRLVSIRNTNLLAAVTNITVKVSRKYPTTAGIRD